MPTIHVCATPEPPTVTTVSFRTIWLKPDDSTIVQIIDQRLPPHEYRVHDLRRWQYRDGIHEIRIEEHAPEEFSYMYGMRDGKPLTVRATGLGTAISNYASEEGLLRFFPEMCDV